jgi:hypothetical protein
MEDRDKFIHFVGTRRARRHTPPHLARDDPRARSRRTSDTRARAPRRATRDARRATRDASHSRARGISCQRGRRRE